MNRLGIFAFSTSYENGYIDTLLKSIHNSLTKVVVVSSHSINHSNCIYKYTQNVFTSCKSSFRFNLYAYALKKLGWDSVREYDEILFFDSSFFCCTPSFGGVFEHMAQKPELDFWSISKIGATSITPDSLCPYTVRPEHLQLYFWVARKRLIQSKSFEEFCKTMPTYKEYADAYDAIESVFTFEFGKRGFLWDAYVDTSDYISDDPEKNYDISVFDAYRLLTEQNMPTVRSELFTCRFERAIRYGAQKVPTQVFRYLQAERPSTGKDVLSWMTQTLSLKQLEAIAGNTHILPDDQRVTPHGSLKMALIVRVRDQGAFAAVQGLQDVVDVFLLCDYDLPEGIHTTFRGVCSDLQSMPTGKALLHAWETWDGFASYDLVGFVDDISLPDDFLTVKEDVNRLRRLSIACTPSYVFNVGQLFADDDTLGLVRPYAAMFGSLFSLRYLNRTCETSALARALKECGLSVPLDVNAPPCVAAESFWCRRGLLAPLIRLLRQQANITSAHMYGELLPYMVQAQGMLTGYAMPACLAETSIVTDTYMLRAITRNVGRLPTVRRNNYIEQLIDDVHGYKKEIHEFDNPDERVKDRIEYCVDSDVSQSEDPSEGMNGTQKAVFDIISRPYFIEGSTSAWRKPKRMAAILSPARVNVIEWMPFCDGDVVVELGSDYGEYTGLLSNRVSKVFCYEANDVCRRILAERCRRCHNIEVYGDFDRMREQLPQRLDWVIIHNLEGIFSNRAEADACIVNLVEQYDVGSVVLLCNNSRGFRYATESWFIQTRDRDANSSVIDLRYTKEEIQELFETKGFEQVIFYYPHPDYVFCKSLFTDEYTPSPGTMMENVWRIPSQRLNPLPERKYFRDNGAGSAYSEKTNCYVAIATHDKRWLHRPHLIRYPSDRKEVFSLVTFIEDDGKVRKRCLSPSARGHVLNASRYTDALRKTYAKSDIILDPIAYSKNGLCYSYIEGTSLHDKLMNEYANGCIEVVQELLLDYCSRISTSHDEGYFSRCLQFESVFGKQSLPPDLRCSAVTNIDVNLDNIIIDMDGNYHIIDCEWVFGFPIPAVFVIWRSIYYFFRKMGKRDGAVVQQLKEECFKSVGITKELQRKFMRMERSFQQYIGL